MDIDELIAREAGSDNEHDERYRSALLSAYEEYSQLTREELERHLGAAKLVYKHQGPTYINTAACMILENLLNDSLDKPFSVGDKVTTDFYKDEAHLIRRVVDVYHSDTCQSCWMVVSEDERGRKLNCDSGWYRKIKDG